MTGVSYATSAEMAGELGPFRKYEEKLQKYAKGHGKPQETAHGAKEGYEGLTVLPARLK